ncbi:TetR/AcrR family transcriptional regulator [Catelliglobosispora koreensis]|uniref:TetR/AcrR family transcriptional regulator n=1 Tax=Catelliglobosispora koreensis TaxID=129052 RepID=UPI00036BC04F|nr:TetR/AcrR family transcriptional regulator [Catelliglobosispora koreensis]
MRSYAGRSAEERRTERREKLIEAALELFGTEGYAATSIEKLCATAGVSTRNFYQEFSGREDLLLAVHGQITERAVAGIAELLSSLENAPLAVRISKAVTEYVRLTAGDPRVARVAYVELVGVSQTVEEHRLSWRAKWSALMEAEAARAASRGEAVTRDFHLSTVAIMGAVNELVYHWSTKRTDASRETVTAELTRLIMALLTVP